MTVVVASYYVEASIISIFQMAMPVLAWFISVLARTEPPPDLRTWQGWAKVVAIVITVTGSVAIVIESPSASNIDHTNRTISCVYGQQKATSSSEKSAGYILLVFNISSFCFYVVLQKRLLYFKKEYARWKEHPVSMMAWATALAYPVQSLTLPLAKLMASEECDLDIDMWTMAGRSWWALEYSVIFNSTINILLIAWAVTRLPPSLVTIWVPAEVRLAVWVKVP